MTSGDENETENMAHVAIRNAVSANVPDPRRDPREEQYTRQVDPDAERRAREIVLAAREHRSLPRGVWVGALLISLLGVIGISIAWWQDRNTVALKPLERHAVEQHESGLWLGLLVGLGLGIAIGSVMALRKKR
jgi:hypothetical protein